MAEPPLYWSAAFTDAFVANLQADEGFQRAARTFDQAIQLRCLDNPEGEDVAVTYRIRRGAVEVERWAEAAPSAALRDDPFDGETLMARTTAPYRIWCRLDRGEMNVLQAIASPDYRLEGPKLKVLRNIRVFNAMSAVAAKTAKRYA
ncbi:MAG: hypothetical protein ACFCGT_11900 [Sandaracinaceae bacterium]